MPALTATIESVRFRMMTDGDPDLSYLEQDYADVAKTDPAEAAKYRAQDAQRLQDYRDGYWHTVGIYAEAKLRFATPQGGWLNGPEVRTGGIWGIESDSGDDYFEEIGQDELEELRAELYALGFGVVEVDVAFEKIERDW